MGVELRQDHFFPFIVPNQSGSHPIRLVIHAPDEEEGRRNCGVILPRCERTFLDSLRIYATF
jgi:hypothetical protein